MKNLLLQVYIKLVLAFYLVLRLLVAAIQVVFADDSIIVTGLANFDGAFVQQGLSSICDTPHRLKPDNF
jgi:integral membrane sensor domain MASE1